MSTADIIAFTDADCIADTNWLRQLVQPFADQEIGGVGGTIRAYDHPHRTLVEMFSDRHSPLVNFTSGAGEFLPYLYTANASYRRRVLAEEGGFNSRLVTAEDVDLAWRIQLKTTARLAWAREAFVFHRHRATRKGLARQYRQYGFGEILLDTMYGSYPGYPRDLRFQARRILSQAAALPRYVVSAMVREVRRRMSRATAYEAVEPRLWFLIESSNVRGKVDGLIATRLMTDAEPALNAKADVLIERLFPGGKE